MSIIEAFNNDIKGEKLLYEKKDNYTEEESELIIKSFIKCMCRNLYYCSMVEPYVNTLVDKVLPNIPKDQLLAEKKVILKELRRNSSIGLHRIFEEGDYGKYLSSVKYGIKDTNGYFDIVKDKILPAEKIKQVLEDNSCVCCYNLDINFLLTTNFLFVRYPKFFTDENINILSEMLSFSNARECLGKEKYKEFKKAEKVTLKFIKEFQRDKKEANKIIKKIQKN